MRLIDADALAEKLKSNINHIQRIIDMKLCDGIKDYRDTERMKKYGYVLNVINDQPTAYDVEKVVNDLEYASYCKSTPTFDRPYTDSIIDLEEAKDIVKRGGAE